MSHDSLSEDLFGVLWHDEAQQIDKSSLSRFSEFQKHFHMMWCNSQTLVILVNSQKNSLFGLGAILEKIMESYSHDLFYDNFVETTQHDGIQQTQAMLVKFPKKFPFREVTCTQIGPNLCNLLSHDFLFEDFLKYCSMKECSWQTIVTFNFAKRYLLGLMGNSDPIWAKITQPLI